MISVLRIRDWDRNFETAETRKLKRMLWVPLPVKQDGDGYSDLLESQDGPLRLSAWVVMLQLASRCSPRGTLVRMTGVGVLPHDAASIGRITRIPAKVIEDAIPKLCEIGWLERAEVDESELLRADESDRLPPPPAIAGSSPGTPVLKGREGKEGNGREGEGGKSPGTPTPVLPSEGVSPPASPRHKRERLHALLTRYGCSMKVGREDVFGEWCNATGSYPIEWLEHLMGPRQQRPNLPSGLRKILKDTNGEYLAWREERAAEKTA